MSGCMQANSCRHARRLEDVLTAFTHVVAHYKHARMLKSGSEEVENQSAIEGTFNRQEFEQVQKIRNTAS